MNAAAFPCMLLTRGCSLWHLEFFPMIVEAVPSLLFSLIHVSQYILHIPLFAPHTRAACAHQTGMLYANGSFQLARFASSRNILHVNLLLHWVIKPAKLCNIYSTSLSCLDMLSSKLSCSQQKPHPGTYSGEHSHPSKLAQTHEGSRLSILVSTEVKIAVKDTRECQTRQMA